LTRALRSLLAAHPKATAVSAIYWLRPETPEPWHQQERTSLPRSPARGLGTERSIGRPRQRLATRSESAISRPGGSEPSAARLR
jgi:hypothetical protein